MVSGAEKVAVVTGSTQGLGEAIARRLVDEGLIGGLVICGRSAENGEGLAREFSAGLPHGVRARRPGGGRGLPARH